MVQIYRISVFSFQTKASIAKLGIGAELDRLEEEQDENDLKKYVRDALNVAFPEAQTVKNSLLEGARRLLEKSKRESDSLKSLTLAKETDDHVERDLNETDGSAGIIDEAIATSVRAFLLDLRDEVSSKVSDLDSAYRQAVLSTRHERRKRLRQYTITAGILALVIFSVWLGLSGIHDKSLLPALLLGIVSNLIGDAIGYIFARISDVAPQRLRDLEEEYDVRLPQDLQIIIDNKLQGFSIRGDGEKLVVNLLKKQWKDALFPKDELVDGNAFASYYRDLRLAQEKIHGVAMEYDNLVDEMTGCYSKFFSERDFKLEAIKQIGVNIKKDLIEPSFSLLEATRKELEAAGDRLKEVKFT